MRRSTVLSLLAISSLLVPALIGAAVAAEAPAAASENGLRARAAALLLEAGADPAPFLAAQVQVDLAGPEPMALGDALDRLDALFPMVQGGDGVAGTPELTVGDFFHMFLHVGSGPGGYVVTPSSLVPATPPLLTPADPVFDVGGPMLTVKGSWGEGMGIHSVGTVFGSNVDTHANGPFVPLVTGSSVYDAAIDFRGHATITEDHVCFFGTCFTWGTMVATGVAAWETLPVDTPAVP